MAKKGKAFPMRKPSERSSAHVLDSLLAQRRFEEALSTGEQLLASSPQNAFVLHKMGVALIHLKNYQRAVEILNQAAQSSEDARLFNDLGIAYEKANNFSRAEGAYLRALKIAPALAEAHSNLADLLFKMDRPDAAIYHAERATKLAPSNPLSWVALGDTLQMQGKGREAIAAFEKAVALPPPQAKAFCSLARSYAAYGRKAEAIPVLEKARALLGDDPNILNDFGLTLGSLRRYEEAQDYFEKAYRITSEAAILYNVLTNLAYSGKVADLLKLADEVIRHPQPNVALTPLFVNASLVCQWDIQDRLVPHFLEWCAMDDRKLTVAGHGLLMMLPLPSVKFEQIREISEKITATYRRHIQHHQTGIDHAKAMATNSKLRIGYLSADLKLHVVNHFVSGQFSNYDKRHFEVYCYSNLAEEAEDEITDQYRDAVDGFVRVSEMDDIALARRIADDGIHLLIDLSGYTLGTRLSVMFHRPAPVQLAYLGYPFTTGVKEVDYVLSDPWLNGPENAGGFVEQILEIPHSFISMGDLGVSRDNPEPPVCRNGYVTFGSLNNSYKLNRETIAAWSRILQQVPESRMILNHPNFVLALTQENIFKQFELNGIGRDRVSIITARHPAGRHLYWYQDIDIALDGFPQTGGTTTADALWMGVPVVTLVGSVHYQRLSYSVLNNSDTRVDDLIAFNLDEYVDRAVALAHNRARIVELHQALTRNVRHSVFCDPARQVRYYEETLIEGWNRKFPQHAKFTPETFVYTRLDSPAVPLVATVSDGHDLFRYVIEEQGRWFAPEYAILKKLAGQFDGLAVEIGGEPGFFSLEVAHAGMRALSLSTSAVVGRLIRAAAEKGGVGERMEVRLESANTNLLDRAALEDVALLRIGLEANDGKAGPIIKNPDFWATNAPLVLLSVHSDDKPDVSTAEALVAMGYRLYCLHPGLGCFVPHCGEPLDAYTLNLLACPPHREAALIASGILVPASKPILADDAAMLRDPAQAIGDPLLQADTWVVHCAARADDQERNVAERLGYHRTALRAQLAIMQAAPSTTRRITLARLLAEAGQRTEAASLLHQALGEIESGSAQPTMPFLAPSATWDRIPPGDRFAEWLLASLLETRCRLAGHSSYFLSPADLSSLDMMASLGFSTAFTEGIKRARGAQH